MISLTADETTIATLNQAKGPAEIRDPSGKLIGFFAPVNPDSTQSAVAGGPIDRMELERRKETEYGGSTTKEVFEHLKSLTVDESMRVYLQRQIDDLEERDRCGTPQFGFVQLRTSLPAFGSKQATDERLPTLRTRLTAC